MKNICDLHTHSVLSKHAYSSLTENIEYANSLGLKYYGIADHQYDSKDVGVHRYAIENLRVVPRVYNGTHILRGVEVNMLNDGSIDLIDPCRMNIDYAVCSLHKYAYGENLGIEKNTENYLKALDDKIVRILGHIDSDLFKCDYERVILKVIDKHKLVEINNSSLDPKGCRKNSRKNAISILEVCKKYNYPVILNSDAHIKYAIGNVDYCLDVVREVDFPIEKILNFNEELFLEYFGDIINKEA